MASAQNRPSAGGVFSLPVGQALDVLLLPQPPLRLRVSNCSFTGNTAPSGGVVANIDFPNDGIHSDSSLLEEYPVGPQFDDCDFAGKAPR